MLSFTNIENALHAWIVAGSGLVADNVLFERDENPRPVGQHIVITYDITPIGQDWAQLESNCDGFIEYTRGMREVRVRLTCVGGEGVGDSSTTARLHGVLTYANRKDQLETFSESGLGYLRRGPITNFAGRAGVKFEPRSQAEVIFSAAEQIEREVSPVEGVEVTLSADEETVSTFVTGEISVDIPTNVEAEAGDEQNVISWDGIAAKTWNIYYDLAPDVDAETGIAIKGVTSPYTHTGLTNGQTYYYVVTAENSYGESDESAEVSATPEAPDPEE